MLPALALTPHQKVSGAFKTIINMNDDEDPELFASQEFWTKFYIHLRGRI